MGSRVLAAALVAAAALPAAASATPMPADTEITPADGIYWVLVPEIGDNPGLNFSPHFVPGQMSVNTRFGSRMPPPADDKHCKPAPGYPNGYCFFGTPMDHVPVDRADFNKTAELAGWPSAGFKGTTKGVKVKNGKIAPKFECNAITLVGSKSGCSSKFTLKTTGPVKVPGEKKKRVVVLAKATLPTADGSIALTAAARKLLARDKHVSATFTIVTHFEWEDVTKTNSRKLGLFL
jgi:hypothetical protein